MKKSVYLSGPVSGLPRAKVVAAFSHARWKMRRQGYTRVINPVELCQEHWNWWRCMAVCLWHLLPARHIYMMKGWNKSRGARIERAVARMLGKRVMYEW